MGKTKITFTLLTIMCTFLYSCKYKEYKNKQLSSYIDSTLQVKATSILENKLSELNALSGQIIIMEVQTGYIKTMVGLERKDSTDYQPCRTFPKHTNQPDAPYIHIGSIGNRKGETI